MSEGAEDLAGEAVQHTVAELERLASRLVVEDEESRQQLAEAVGQQVNGVLRAVRERGLSADTHEAVRDLAARLNEQVDFGLLRDTVERRAEDLGPLAADVARIIASDPVAMANLLGILPTLVNASLRVTRQCLAALGMPAEVKASAVFALLGQLDTEAVAQVINLLSSLVVELHEGNLVLGGTEPRLREVFTRLTESVLDDVDKERAALLVVALAEDLEVIAASLGDVAWRDPDLLFHIVAAMMSSVHAVMRGLTDAAGRLQQLPDEAVDQLTATIDEHLEAQTVARLINGVVALTERLLERHPQLPEKVADQLGEVLDGRRLVGVSRKLLGPLVARAWRAGGGATGLTPAALGEALSAAVQHYNRSSSDDPDRVGKGLTEVVDQLDARQLEQALERTLSQVGATLARRPELVLAVVYDFFDGLSETNGCDHLRGMFENWHYARKLDFFHYLKVPHLVTEEGIEYFAEELELFRQALAELVQKEVTDGALCDAVKRSNRVRGKLHRVLAQRERARPGLTGAEALSLFLVESAVPPDVFEPQLDSLLDQLPTRQLPKPRARLLLGGAATDEITFVEQIEGLGALVVADSLCYGSRATWKLDLPEDGGNPLPAMARATLEHLLCPRMFDDYDMRLDFLLQAAKRARIDGAVLVYNKFCDLHGVENVRLRRDLEKQGIPVLVLEKEYGAGADEGRISTRVQAFLERIGG